jgi:CubicO group peptidase (beta-lactamase class C family)
LARIRPNGKQAVTVRQLLAHQAGLFAFDEPVDRSVVADLDRLAELMARHKPAWEPGTRQAYHGLTLGFYEGELIRRVDPRHRTLGRFFQDEIATPLGEDVYIRLPDDPERSPGEAVTAGPDRDVDGVPPAATHGRGDESSLEYLSSARRQPWNLGYLDEGSVYSRNLDVPAGGGVGTARGIAHAYGVFASGGRELGLRKETLDLLAARAVPATHGFYDECLKGEVQFSLGFMKPCDNWRFGGPRSFGSPGTGGALGFADPDAGVGYAYVTSRMGMVFTGDPRDLALREALYSALPVSPDAH